MEIAQTMQFVWIPIVFVIQDMLVQNVLVSCIVFKLVIERFSLIGFPNLDFISIQLTPFNCESERRSFSNLLIG